MAKVTFVKVGYSRTFNLGEYNSAKFECELGAELEEGDDADKVTGDLMSQAKTAIKEASIPLYPYMVIPRTNPPVTVVERFQGMNVQRDESSES